MAIIIAGKITLDPAKRDEMLAAAAVLMAATHEEPGNIEYVFSADAKDADTVRVFEKWEAEDALGPHFTAPHMVEFQGKMGDFGVTGADLLKYEIASEGPLH